MADLEGLPVFTYDIDKAVDDFMAAVVAKDGARLLDVCSGDAKLYGSDGELFIDLKEFSAAEEVTKHMEEKMGPVSLEYTDRVKEFHDSPTDRATETHGVTVRQGEEVVAQLTVKVSLEFDEDGKITKMSEEVVSNEAEAVQAVQAEVLVAEPMEAEPEMCCRMLGVVNGRDDFRGRRALVFERDGRLDWNQ